MDERVQALWNSILDECAEKQWATASGSPGETTRDLVSKGGHRVGNETTHDGIAVEPGAQAPAVMGTNGSLPTNGYRRNEFERDAIKNEARCQGGRATDRVVTGRTKPPRAVKSSTSLGQVLEDTAHPHLVNFSKAELELWGWHRGNLEISCGAVRVPGSL